MYGRVRVRVLHPSHDILTEYPQRSVCVCVCVCVCVMLQDVVQQSTEYAHKHTTYGDVGGTCRRGTTCIPDSGRLSSRERGTSQADQVRAGRPVGGFSCQLTAALLVSSPPTDMLPYAAANTARSLQASSGEHVHAVCFRERTPTNNRVG